MTDLALSQLNPASTVNNSDLLLLTQAGTSVKITAQTFALNMPSRIIINEASESLTSGAIATNLLVSKLASSTPIAISSASWSGGVATFVYGSAHGYTTGQTILIAGMSPSGYNGTYVIASTPLSTTLTVANATTLGASSVSGTSNYTYTLAAGTHGMEKEIVCIAANGGTPSSQITVTSGSGMSTLSISSVGQSTLLKNVDGSWYVISENSTPGVSTYTGTGSTVLSTAPTITNAVLVTPALGTPSSGNLSSCTFPTLNQNTSGTAAGLSSTLVATSGGTGQSTYTVGDILIGGATNTLTKLAGVALGSVLVSGGAGSAPSWSTTLSITSISATGDIKGAGYHDNSTVVNSTASLTTATLTAYNTYFTGTAGASFAVTLPTVSSAEDGAKVTIFSVNTRVSTTWVVAGTATTTVGLPVTLVAATPYHMKYVHATTTWYLD